MNESNNSVFPELLEKRWKLAKYYLIFLSILAFTSFILSVRVGVMDISYLEIITVLLEKTRLSLILPNSFSPVGESKEFVIVNLRFPRAILSMFVGVALAMSGCVFQAVFKNPLADPYIIGVASGAALGAATAIVLGLHVTFLGVSGISATAFIGALITIIIVYYIASVGGRPLPVTLLLTGVVISIFLSALLSILMVFSGRELHVLIFWLMGGFSHARWPYVTTSIPIIMLTSILIMLFSRNLNLMLLSEEEAQHLGVEIYRAMKFFLVLGSLITAVAVSYSGSIGFVGLIVPHIMRILVGPDHRILLPSSALMGASLLTFCDIVARSVFPPIELPVGIITALIGGPFFLYLLYRRRYASWRF